MINSKRQLTVNKLCAELVRIAEFSEDFQTLNYDKYFGYFINNNPLREGDTIIVRDDGDCIRECKIIRRHIPLGFNKSFSITDIENFEYKEGMKAMYYDSEYRNMYMLKSLDEIGG